MKDFGELLSSLDCTIAVVGATDNLAKFGAVIYRDLKRKGYRVFPVNPGRTKVDGDRCYSFLADLPETPSILNFVVPPLVTRQILESCLEINCTLVWLQPGSEDKGVIDFLKQHNFNYLAGPCIMVETQ